MSSSPWHLVGYRKCTNKEIGRNKLKCICEHWGTKCKENLQMQNANVKYIYYDLFPCLCISCTKHLDGKTYIDIVEV